MSFERLIDKFNFNNQSETIQGIRGKFIKEYVIFLNRLEDFFLRDNYSMIRLVKNFGH